MEDLPALSMKRVDFIRGFDPARGLALWQAVLLKG